MSTATYSLALLGPPGVGKSSMAGSITEVVPAEEVLLIVAKPGEEKSWRYQAAGLTEKAEIYHDPDWLPVLGSFKAEGFIALMKRLKGLQKDTAFGAVIIDPGTDVIGLLEHYLLAPSAKASPGDLENTQGFYRQLKDTAESFVKLATSLASARVAARPKHILIPWHVQPAKEGQVVGKGPARAKVESADERGAGIEYEGNVLFMLEGAYRRNIAGDFDLCLYMDFKPGIGNRPPEFFACPVPNADRHAKLRACPALSGTLPPTMKALLEAVEAAREGK